MSTLTQSKKKETLPTLVYFLSLSSLVWIGLAILISMQAQAQTIAGQNVTPISGWVSPRLPDSVKKTLEERFEHLDPEREVPLKGLKQALQFFMANEENIPNKKFLTIIDYARRSSVKRLFLVNLETGNVGTFFVAHGKGSDTNHDGYADRFSDINESRMTSLGFFLTGETYYGQHGLSMRLHGVSHSNDQAFRRAIVFHGADYVGDEFDTLGRSFGCPAIEQRNVEFLISRIKGGSLFYAWYDEDYVRPETNQAVQRPRNVPQDQQE